ncbi:hypothetical protein CEXT_649461 [Caerostris extrusa]|uniref:Uncharacterized protein n=1 Tax=Caerostris extrusa TaxID=172846 RepID=A0AAV4VTA6_CAEEX|nr:hypothetical protein CEXT_649461 [Caerostris extrusa]
MWIHVTSPPERRTLCNPKPHRAFAFNKNSHKIMCIMSLLSKYNIVNPNSVLYSLNMAEIQIMPSICSPTFHPSCCCPTFIAIPVETKGSKHSLKSTKPESVGG